MKFDLEFIDVAKAAKLLRLSPQRVRVLLAKGRLQGVCLASAGGRAIWRVHASLIRRPAKPGRPATKRRTAAAVNGGSEAKP